MSASAITDGLRLQGHQQFQHAVVALGTAQTAQLRGGLYDVWSPIDDFYIKVGASVAPIPATPDNTTAAALDASPTTSYLIRGGNTVTVFVPYGARIGFYSATAQTVSLHKVGE